MTIPSWDKVTQNAHISSSWQIMKQQNQPQLLLYGGNRKIQVLIANSFKYKIYISVFLPVWELLVVGASPPRRISFPPVSQLQKEEEDCMTLLCFPEKRSCMRHEKVWSIVFSVCLCGRGLSSMEASSITKPSFTDQHHGQQPGSSVVVLMEEQARGSKATGDQLQL